MHFTVHNNELKETYLYIATAQANFVLSANEERGFNIPVTIKTGYKALEFMTVRATGNSSVIPSGDNSYSNGQATVYLKNTLPASATIYIIVSILCHKVT